MKLIGYVIKEIIRVKGSTMERYWDETPEVEKKANFYTDKKEAIRDMEDINKDTHGKLKILEVFAEEDDIGYACDLCDLTFDEQPDEKCTECGGPLTIFRYGL